MSHQKNKTSLSEHIDTCLDTYKKELYEAENISSTNNPVLDEMLFLARCWNIDHWNQIPPGFNLTEDAKNDHYIQSFLKHLLGYFIKALDIVIQDCSDKTDKLKNLDSKYIVHTSEVVYLIPLSLLTSKLNVLDDETKDILDKLYINLIPDNKDCHFSVSGKKDSENLCFNLPILNTYAHIPYINLDSLQIIQKEENIIIHELAHILRKRLNPKIVNSSTLDKHMQLISASEENLLTNLDIYYNNPAEFDAYFFETIHILMKKYNNDFNNSDLIDLTNIEDNLSFLAHLNKLTDNKEFNFLFSLNTRNEKRFIRCIKNYILNKGDLKEYKFYDYYRYNNSVPFNCNIIFDHDDFWLYTHSLINRLKEEN